MPTCEHSECREELKTEISDRVTWHEFNERAAKYHEERNNIWKAIAAACVLTVTAIGGAYAFTYVAFADCDDTAQQQKESVIRIEESAKRIEQAVELQGKQIETMQKEQKNAAKERQETLHLLREHIIRGHDSD